MLSGRGGWADRWGAMPADLRATAQRLLAAARRCAKCTVLCVLYCVYCTFVIACGCSEVRQMYSTVCTVLCVLYICDCLRLLGGARPWGDTSDATAPDSRDRRISMSSPRPEFGNRLPKRSNHHQRTMIAPVLSQRGFRRLQECSASQAPCGN